MEVVDIFCIDVEVDFATGFSAEFASGVEHDAAVSE